MVLWDYYYFGSKDHEQCLEKAWYVTKLGILGGELPVNPARLIVSQDPGSRPFGSCTIRDFRRRPLLWANDGSDTRSQ